MSVFKLKKWPSRRIVTSCTLLISLLSPTIVFAADGRDDYDLDNDGLIEINDLADLDEIRKNLDGKTLYGSNVGCPNAEDGTVNGGCIGFELTADLDFDTNQDDIMDTNDTYWSNGEGWQPIGTIGSVFSTTFEGNGHQISNLYINRTSSHWGRWMGLFGFIDQAGIRNLVLTGSLMSITGTNYVGGLVGRSNSSQISNIINTGSVHGSYMTGGLVGISSSSLIENIINTGSVQSSGNFTGGLVGKPESSQINNTISTGFVYGSIYTGGLIGWNNSSNTISNSYWATDSSGQATSGGSSETTSYVGLTLTILQCAVQANTNSGNSSCVSTEGLNAAVSLFNQWDEATQDGQALWDFGSNTQLPALVLNGIVYRDSDGDGPLDNQDHWPNNPAAHLDSDSDGHPDSWTLGCDTTCIAASGLTLDQFPVSDAAWQDDDFDGLPDSWINSCDTDCQTASGLVLDAKRNDTDNDGLTNLEDNDDNNDGITDADANSNGLIEINTLEQLNAMRHQLDGSGLRLTSDIELDPSGCPATLYQGQVVQRCYGYELTADLDFDTNQDGILNSNDIYWNENDDAVGEGWLPIGINNYKFNAIFEGNGHQIRNLYINRTSNDEIGLFGFIRQADIRNLVLTGPLMSVTGRSNVGSLVGRSWSSQISNTLNTGSVQGTNNYTGGLVGESYLSQIENSMNTGSVQSVGHYTGGLVGNSNSSQISNTISTGFVSGSSSVGGLIGTGNSNNSTINSYWATDSSGQASSYGISEAESYLGVPLTTLQCAIQANTSSDNSSCVSSDGITEGLDAAAILFNQWDQTHWDFGTTTQLPALLLNEITYRDSDGDGSLDSDDAWPSNPAAYLDTDADGYPDLWTLGCDNHCIVNSSLTFDYFPSNTAAWKDEDYDGLPDAWAENCDSNCQIYSGLVLDTYLSDSDNDGLNNSQDSDNNNDGITDADADHDGLIEINSLTQLNAIRYQSDGIGLRLTTETELDQSGCPATLYQGKMIKRCIGYELTTDLDFDTNQDRIMDSNDDYWNTNVVGVGEGWLPIFGFSAVFEGNGHTINNLYINRGGSVGLFGSIRQAEIRNLVLTGPLMLIKGGSDVGSLVGSLTSSKITNCINTGPVWGSQNIGGLAGTLRDSLISNSMNTGAVEASYERTGGLAGYVRNSIISNSMNTGYIQSPYRSGGLVGVVYDSQINNTVNTGQVKGIWSVGGLLGTQNVISNTVNNSYWATDSSGRNYNTGQSEPNSYWGVTLATLQCATQANTNPNNSDCVSDDGSAEGLNAPMSLFKNWDSAVQGGQAIWHFGNSRQLPALVLNGITYRDTDGDGSLDEYDVLPFDSDNDGIDNIQDVYPFFAIGDLADRDNDGAPDSCNDTCLALGMFEDTDNDNDNVPDTMDAFPYIALGGLTDTDNDGIPNSCDIDCLALGMSADTDDDNDGVLDVNDAYPLIAVGNLLDTDNDGTPDTCDANCLALNMTADEDDDNDGVPDINDRFPLDSSEHSDFDNDGQGDVADLDDDNDGVLDVNDPHQGNDNGAPELLFVADASSFAVTSDNGFTYDLLVDENFFMAFSAIDARDTVFTYEASLDGSPLSADENDIMLIPAGRNGIQWIAIDGSGNRSEPVEQVINVYPQVRFDKSTSIIGEASFTEIKVRLTGDSPSYPVVVTFEINDTSDADQDDFSVDFDITTQHQVIIEAGDAESLNREAFINIPIIEDNESENDERLILDLVTAKLQSESDDDIESLFTVNEDNQQHELTITYQNLAPTVQFRLEQSGLEVANIQQDGGMVTLTAVVQDGNGNDVHSFIWDIDSLGLNAPLGISISFDPINLAEGTYDISVTATDNGIGQLSDDALLSLEIIAPVQESRDGESTGSGGSGGGSINWWFMLVILGLISGLRAKRRELVNY